MCASRFQRTLRETGATRAACAAQNRARQFRVKRVCSEVAALGFPPLAGVAPDPLREGQHSARPTARAAFGYSRGDWDSTRTLRGHFARAARIVRPSIGGASGHFKHEGGRRARRGRCLGRGGSIGSLGSIGSEESSAAVQDGSAAKRESSAAVSDRSAALYPASAAENETEGRTSSLKTGNRGTLGGWGDLALRGNAL